MASFTLTATPFPDGTTVGAYNATGYSSFPVNGPPATAVTTATASERRVAFTGLEPATTYFAAALVGEHWRNVVFIVGAELGELEFADIAGTLAAAQLAAAVVEAVAIKTGAVTNEKLAANAVSEAKIENGAVSAGKLATAAKELFLRLAVEEVASANTITVTKAATLVKITGTTEIKKINATAAGHLIVLKFASTSKVIDGENLKLNASFEPAADSTLTLICDGTNWYETARSKN